MYYACDYLGMRDSATMSADFGEKPKRMHCIRHISGKRDQAFAAKPGHTAGKLPGAGCVRAVCPNLHSANRQASPLYPTVKTVGNRYAPGFPAARSVTVPLVVMMPMVSVMVSMVAVVHDEKLFDFLNMADCERNFFDNLKNIFLRSRRGVTCGKSGGFGGLRKGGECKKETFSDSEQLTTKERCGMVILLNTGLAPDRSPIEAGARHVLRLCFGLGTICALRWPVPVRAGNSAMPVLSPPKCFFVSGGQEMNTVPNPLHVIVSQATESAPQASPQDYLPEESSDRLSNWLHTARELLWELINRRRLLDRLHPRRNLIEDNADVLELELDETEISITDLGNKLAVIENCAPLLGAAAMLRDPGQLHRNAIVALSLSRLSDAFYSDVDTVGAVAALAAGHDPAGALTIRDAFRETGVLRKHVHLERRNLNIDNWKIGLTETSLAQVLGRECDSELQAVSYFRDYIRKGV